MPNPFLKFFGAFLASLPADVEIATHYIVNPASQHRFMAITGDVESILAIFGSIVSNYQNQSKPETAMQGNLKSQQQYNAPTQPQAPSPVVPGVPLT